MKANGPEPNLKTFREVVIQAIEGEISNFDFKELDYTRARII